MNTYMKHNWYHMPWSLQCEIKWKQADKCKTKTPTCLSKASHRWRHTKGNNVNTVLIGNLTKGLINYRAEHSSRRSVLEVTRNITECWGYNYEPGLVPIYLINIQQKPLLIISLGFLRVSLLVLLFIWSHTDTTAVYINNITYYLKDF